ncbi:MAG: serine--tRNA ligase [Alphaproteobacteria bacterium]|nr:serine--tRNA ligase [Alphaproteobacteria bacterium]
MHDIKLIREEPASFDKAMMRRNLPATSDQILKIDGERRAAQTAMQEAQARRNDLSKQVGEMKRTGGNAETLMQEVAALKDRMAEIEVLEKELGIQLDAFLQGLPNRPAADVPDGKDEADNKEIRRIGTPPGMNAPRQHFELGEDLGMMDSTTAAKLSGARFTMLTSQLARLERAIGNFMLDLHTTEFGYTEVSPPLMVRDEIVYGTGNLPKFAEDLFRTTTGLWLIPTAEVPLTNVVNGDIVDADTLPMRMTARTPCFRSEAGSAGRDTRGMLRQHQFYKVELVSITRPDQSTAEHERMTECAETVLKRLEVPFRTVVLCTGDMGFCSQKTYDIEAWLPGQNTYREISSCSNCGDFQARRMNARYRAAGEKNTNFVHTLNGSGLAIGRCLIAIMENFQNPDGSIAIPAALRPYMGGLEKIELVKNQ